MAVLSILVNAFIIGLSGAMMPGPLLTQTINRSARGGVIAAPLIILGHGILELLLIVGLIFGLGTVLTNATVSAVIGIVGGLVLLWMGYDIIKSTYFGKISFSAQVEKTDEAREQETEEKVFCREKAGNVLTGFFVSGSNPYFLIWWASVGIVLFNESRKTLGLGGPFVFYTGHILSDLAWYFLVGYVIAKGKNIIPEKVYRGLLIFCGLFLLGYSVKLIIYGLTTL